MAKKVVPAATPAKPAKAPKVAKAAAAPAEAEAKVKFGSDMRITEVGDNPRREGTGGHSKFADMKAFMKKRPKATVADVIAETTYKRNDFQWDFDRDAIKAVTI